MKSNCPGPCLQCFLIIFFFFSCDGFLYHESLIKYQQAGLGDDAGGVWRKNWSHGHGIPKGSCNTFGNGDIKEEGWIMITAHTDGKVHVPQVWSNRDDPAARRTLYSSGRHQLYLPLIIVFTWYGQVNIINEKIYFFLWFWFVALAIITGVQQVWGYILSSRLRDIPQDQIVFFLTLFKRPSFEYLCCGLCCQIAFRIIQNLP